METTKAVLHCWPPLLLSAIPLLALALSGQGREALTASIGKFGEGPLALLCTWPIIVGIYASLICYSEPSSPTSPFKEFGRSIAPWIASIISCFSLPLLLKDTVTLDITSLALPDFPGNRSWISSVSLLWQGVGPLVVLTFLMCQVAIMRCGEGNAVAGYLCAVSVALMYMAQAVLFGIGLRIEGPALNLGPYVTETAFRAIPLLCILFALSFNERSKKPKHPSTSLLPIQVGILVYLVVFFFTDHNDIILSRRSRNQRGYAIVVAGAATWRGDNAGGAC